MRLCVHAQVASEAMAWADRLAPPPKLARLGSLGIRRPRGVIVDMTQTLAAKIALVLPYECAAGYCLHDKTWQR